MKKITLTVAILLFGYVSSHAQQKSAPKFTDENTKGWVGFAIGPNFPVGAVANTDPLSEDAGYASTGIHLNLNLGYKIAGPVGLSVLLHTNVNKVNQEALDKLFSATVPAGFSGSYTVKPWYMSGALIGPYFTLPSSGATSFYIRGLIGYANVTNPETAITLSKPGYQAITGTTEASDFMGFSYSVGSGANIRLGKKIQLMLNVDFITTTVTVKGLKTTYSNGAPYSVGDSYTQPYSVVNVTGGIGYVIQ